MRSLATLRQPKEGANPACQFLLYARQRGGWSAPCACAGTCPLGAPQLSSGHRRRLQSGGRPDGLFSSEADIHLRPSTFNLRLHLSHFHTFSFPLVVDDCFFASQQHGISRYAVVLRLTPAQARPGLPDRRRRTLIGLRQPLPLDSTLQLRAFWARYLITLPTPCLQDHQPKEQPRHLRLLRPERSLFRDQAPAPGERSARRKQPDRGILRRHVGRIWSV